MIFLAMTILPLANLSAQEEAVAMVNSPVDQQEADVIEEPVQKKDLAKMSVDERRQLIFEAVDSRNTEKVEPLLCSSVYYLKNEAGETILTQAILNGDEKMASLLVKNAISNFKNDTGETPLTLALKLGKRDMANILLTRAKPSLKNNFGEAPLLLALDLDDLQLIQNMIDRGADVNRKSNGITPLARAVNLKQMKTVASLIRNGAEISTPNDNGETPLYLAVNNGLTVMTGVLLYKSHQPGRDANWQTPVGEPLLNLATLQGDEQMVRLLLDSGADPNEVDFMENSGLNIAAENGFDAIALLYLSRGADPDHANILGTTPIMAAAQNGNEKLAGLLAEQGANPDDRNYEGIAANDFGDFNFLLTDEDLQESIIEAAESN